MMLSIVSIMADRLQQVQEHAGGDSVARWKFSVPVSKVSSFQCKGVYAQCKGVCDRLRYQRVRPESSWPGVIFGCLKEPHVSHVSACFNKFCVNVMELWVIFKICVYGVVANLTDMHSG